MKSMNIAATQWLASACRDSVRLVDGPARLRQEKSVLSQESASYARAHFGGRVTGAPVFGAGVPSAPAVIAAAEVPTQQITKGGLCGPQPWRDAPVIT